MVVFDVVCTKQKCQSPVRKKVLSSDQVLWVFFFFFFLKVLLVNVRNNLNL